MTEMVQNQLIVDQGEFDRVFLWCGDVAHLINPTQPRLPNQPASKLNSLCGKGPMWPSVWFGYTEEDAKRAAELPLCGGCRVSLEAMRRVVES